MSLSRQQPPPHPLPRNRRAFQRRLCVHFSCAAPSVFNTLQRPSDYPEYFSMTWDELGLTCCGSFWEHVTCGWFSQEPAASTAPLEVFFSLGAVSPTPGVTERRAKPHRDLMTVPSRVQDERTEDPERTSRNGFIKPDQEAEALVCVT